MYQYGARENLGNKYHQARGHREKVLQLQAKYWYMMKRLWNLIKSTEI